ncbi:hypothetical protein JHV675_06260 [Mycobacterium avium subsp. hominissuis]
MALMSTRRPGARAAFNRRERLQEWVIIDAVCRPWYSRQPMPPRFLNDSRSRVGRIYATETYCYLKDATIIARIW